MHDIGESFSNLELLAGANHYLLHHHHHHHPHTGVQITHYCIYLLQIPPIFLIKSECFTGGDHYYREHITRRLDSSQGFPSAMFCSHRIAESSSSNKILLSCPLECLQNVCQTNPDSCTRMGTPFCDRKTLRGMCTSNKIYAPQTCEAHNMQKEYHMLCSQGERGILVQSSLSSSAGETF